MASSVDKVLKELKDGTTRLATVRPTARHFEEQVQSTFQQMVTGPALFHLEKGTLGHPPTEQLQTKNGSEENDIEQEESDMAGEEEEVAVEEEEEEGSDEVGEVEDVTVEENEADQVVTKEEEQEEEIKEEEVEEEESTSESRDKDLDSILGEGKVLINRQAVPTLSASCFFFPSTRQVTVTPLDCPYRMFTEVFSYFYMPLNHQSVNYQNLTPSEFSVEAPASSIWSSHQEASPVYASLRSFPEAVMLSRLPPLYKVC